jgi:translation initiation factor 5A
MVTKPTPIKSLKPGHFVMSEDGEPCRIVDITISKPGKHGSTKARVDVMGIFDNRRRSILRPASDELEVPVIEKRKAQVISISGEIAELMDLETYETFSASIPEEFKGKLEPGGEISYWKIENRVLIKQFSSE